MSQPSQTLTATQRPGEDCPLSTNLQNRNIFCFAAFWSVYYLAAPVSYVGLTHANLLKALGNTDTVSNLPSAVYMWLTIVPVLVAWLFPRPRHLKPLALLSIGSMACVTAAVAVTLGNEASAEVSTWVVIIHGAVLGASNGVLITTMWDFVRRGVSTSRRGRALGFAFAIGPLFACVGALLQDALFGGKLLGGHSFGLTFPHNFVAMFAGVSPLFLLAGMAVGLFTIPDVTEPTARFESPWTEIRAGIRQFVRSRNVLFAVVIYVVVYSGGNAIFQNVSLHAQTVLSGEQSDSLGLQSFLRFGFKAVTGGMLGWLLSAASPRATLLATTSILLMGMIWALTSSGGWFMLTFGLLGAGELFGAYFPNYVATASEKPFVRINMAYLSVLSSVIGFSSLAFGAISDHFGRLASFSVAAGLLVFALLLIGLLLPSDPTPRAPPHRAS